MRPLSTRPRVRAAWGLLRPLHALVVLAAPLAALSCDRTARGDETTFPLERTPLALTEEVRVGSLDDDATALTLFFGLAVDDDGTIYTAYPMESVVRVHDVDGALVRVIGGAGDGPGEFRSPAVVGLHADTLWVLDNATLRFSLFTRDGTFIRSWQMPIPSPQSSDDRPPLPEGLLAGGDVLAAPRLLLRDVALGRVSEQSMLRVRPDGTVVDTLARFSVSSIEIDLPQARPIYQEQPFHDGPLAAVSMHEAAVVRVHREVERAADSLHVVKHDFEGDTLFSRVFAYRPVPIASDAVDSVLTGIAGIAANAQTGLRADQIAARVREQLHVPGHHPPVSRIVPGRDGTTWLRRERASADRVRWTLLDAEGTPIGTVDAPARFEVLAADRNHAWGMLLDELDVPYLVRYRVD